MGIRAHAAVLESIERIERWEVSLSIFYTFWMDAASKWQALSSRSSQERTR
jgi:hypothetical protein